MKNTAYTIIRLLLLTTVSMGVLFLISCEKKDPRPSGLIELGTEVIDQKCTNYVIESKLLDDLTLVIDSKSLLLELHTSDGGDFTEDLQAVVISAKNAPLNIEISKGDGSPARIAAIRNVLGHDESAIAAVFSENCPEPFHTGSLTLPELIRSGEMILVNLTDEDLNTSATSKERITISVASDKGEVEDLELIETENNTGIFSGTLATANTSAAGTDNDGMLNANEGTVVTVTYEDAIKALIFEDVIVEAKISDLGISVTESVTVNAPLPTCDDGIQNGDETGVDCGGPDCDACALADGEITFNGTVYTLDDNSSSFTPYGGGSGIIFDMSTSDASFAISLDFYSTTTVDGGTYTVNGDPEGIDGTLSAVYTDSGSNSYFLTGGSATLTINGGVYTLSLDLTTEGGGLTGTYTFP